MIEAAEGSPWGVGEHIAVAVRDVYAQGDEVRMLLARSTCFTGMFLRRSRIERNGIR